MKQFAYLLILSTLVIQCNSSLSPENEASTKAFSPGDEIRTYIFGHSLLNHDFEVDPPTPSNETSVPHWFVELADSAEINYQVSGQYGFLPQHAMLPPTAQWGFDNVPSPWDSDFQNFSEADFNSVLITAANFIQYKKAHEPYDGDASYTSPLDATIEIADWLVNEEPGIDIYIYENWPDMAAYISSFPPPNREVDEYHEITRTIFHEWWIEYQDSLVAARPDQNIKMIPVGPIIAKLLVETPICDVSFNNLYEDDAPHGRPNIYFLAALITYMGMTEEKAPSNYEVPIIIDPLIRDNYQLLIDSTWAELSRFNFSDGSSRVW